MRLIDADALGLEINRKAHENFPANMNLTLYASSLLAHAPAIDAVPVVRCGECKHSRPLSRTEPLELTFVDGCVWCEEHADGMFENDFCSYGERREGDGYA